MNGASCGNLRDLASPCSNITSNPSHATQEAKLGVSARNGRKKQNNQTRGDWVRRANSTSVLCHSPCPKIVCRVRKNTVEPLAEEAGAETGETSLLAGLTTEQVRSGTHPMSKLVFTNLWIQVFLKSLSVTRVAKLSLLMLVVESTLL